MQISKHSLNSWTHVNLIQNIVIPCHIRNILQARFVTYIKCFDDNVYNKPPIVYTTETAEDDVAQVFIDLVEKDVKDIFTRFHQGEDDF